jgi:hypothetical protein
VVEAEWATVIGESLEDTAVSQEALAGAQPAARVPLGQLLIQNGFITQVQLDDALYEGSRTGERLGEVVVRRGLASEDDVARLLAEQWSLDYVDRSSIWFDADALTRLSREDAQRLEALPTRVEDGRVVVAVAEPTEGRLEALRDLIGDETIMIVVPKSALDAGLRSDLLRSSPNAKGQFSAAEEEPPVEPPPAATKKERKKAERPEPEPEQELELDPDDLDLASVTELPIQRLEMIDTDTDSDAVVLLADEAQAVAERLAAQAAAVREHARQQQELRLKTEEYESRIQDLEYQLGERTEHLERLRGQLAEMLGSFGD